MAKTNTGVAQWYPRALHGLGDLAKHGAVHDLLLEETVFTPTGMA